MTPNKRRPGRSNTRATRKTPTTNHYTEPPTAADRAEAAILAAAAELGYRLAVQCTRCQQWLVAPESIAAHKGPRCRRADTPQAGWSA